METKFYAVPNTPLCLSLTTHQGKLTKADVQDNLVKAMRVSNENGEDWMADIELLWDNKDGMILGADENPEMLENEEVMRRNAEDLTNEWGEKSDQALMLLGLAGVGKELTEVQKEVIEEAEEVTLAMILGEEMPYESPYV